MRTMRTHAKKMAVAVLATAALASPAPAQISCGDTLGPGGTFTATSDIGPCVENPAVRIVGAVKVDFAGFEVTCDANTSVGILVEGTLLRELNREEIEREDLEALYIRYVAGYGENGASDSTDAA